ncbi:MAG TPA: hypothetical protein VFV88_04175 [Steroidobacteraceae bacterium]|jgi:hypothetical protein|nr:hypothetical protein [Steroidobacteraceae bacterium]
MVMKRSRITDLYRSGSQPLPAATTDAGILAAARTHRESRSPLRFAVAAAAVLVAVFIARWYLPGEHGPAISNDDSTTDFGIQEGQAHSWLGSYQPSLTVTGPGSQEGKS